MLIIVPKFRDGSSPGGGARAVSNHRSFLFKIMNCFVYILQSKKTNGYYIGQTENVTIRLAQHNAEDNSHFTFRDMPWVLKVVLECNNRNHAMKLEAFIKKQKSKVFIQKIISSTEVQQSLILKFIDC